MVFFQSVKHVQKPQSQIQHSKLIQAKQSVQNGHEGDHLQPEIVGGKKPQLASRGLKHQLLRKRLQQKHSII